MILITEPHLWRDTDLIAVRCRKCAWSDPVKAADTKDIDPKCFCGKKPSLVLRWGSEDDAIVRPMIMRSIHEEWRYNHDSRHGKGQGRAFRNMRQGRVRKK